MNSNEIILVTLLIVTLILLVFHYLIDICDFSYKQPFKESFATINVRVGDREPECMIEDGKTRFDNDGFSSLTTLDAIKKKFERNYHTDYTCNARMGKGKNLKNNVFFGRNDNYTGDIVANNLLLAYNCIALRPKTLKAKLLNLRFNDVKVFNEDNFSMIESSDCDITSDESINELVKNNIKSDVVGPVYVCISQAPFWEGMNARFTVDKHMTSCYIKNEEKYGKCSNLVSKCEILLVYLNGNQRQIDTFAKYIKDNKSHHDLCHIKCNKGNLSCGCMGLENAYSFNGGNDVYSSKCYGPDDKNVPGIAPLSDYSMIYFINPYNNKGVTTKPWNYKVTYSH